MKRYTEREIENILNKLYGQKYEIPKITHCGSQEKYGLICKKHGIFYYRFDKLLSGNCICKECKEDERKLKKINEYIKRAKEIHSDKYDYSKINVENFHNSETKVPIVCKKHGVFYQSFNNHINSKQGCRKCYNESIKGKTKISRDEFIKRANKIHNSFYSYDNLIYTGTKNKVKITCPIHGDFEQIAYDHLRGFKCEKCKYDRNRDTIDGFIQKAKKIHGNKYDYSKIDYINNHIQVTITCPIHGDFKQTPSAHLLGCGCQKCHRSRLEEEVSLFLENKNINFEEQKAFDWLGKLRLDFYLPDYKIGIECQGGQHFEPIYFGGNKNKAEKEFVSIIERDKRKYKKCNENGIKVLYFTNKEYVKKSDNLYDDLNKMFEENIK